MQGDPEEPINTIGNADLRSILAGKRKSEPGPGHSPDVAPSKRLRPAPPSDDVADSDWKPTQTTQQTQE
jgi:hypothetical protein